MPSLEAIDAHIFCVVYVENQRQDEIVTQFVLQLKKTHICIHKKEYLHSRADIHFVRCLYKQAKDNEMLPTVCADCKKDITINSCTLKSIHGVAV